MPRVDWVMLLFSKRKELKRKKSNKVKASPKISVHDSVIHLGAARAAITNVLGAATCFMTETDRGYAQETVL